MKRESINKQEIRCYDNGGKTADRYTVVYVGQLAVAGRNDVFESVGMSAAPFHPQGFGQHSAALPGRHLGKRIPFADLPADCQKLVMRDLAINPNNERDMIQGDELRAAIRALDSECSFGRHYFKNGACARCGIDQNNLIAVYAMRWFQRTYGNTYHKVRIALPTTEMDSTANERLESDRAYGYDDSYKQTALELICKHYGWVYEAVNPQAFLAVHGFYATFNVQDVQRQKDL